MLPYKNLSCSLSVLHENKNEVDRETCKAEKTETLHLFTPQRSTKID